MWPSPGERVRKCFLRIGKQSKGREEMLIMMEKKPNMPSLKLLIERHMLNV